MLILLVLKMENSKDFKSKVRTIHSKNLRKFLTVYFYTYVYENIEDNPLIINEKRTFPQKRAPRIPPGLKAIIRFLRCSRATAQYYLRAVNITHNIFVNSEIEKTRKEKPLVRITEKDYEKLRYDLLPLFEQISEIIKHDINAPRIYSIRQLLQKVVILLSKTSSVFTQDDCAKIIEELASLLI